MMTPYPVLEEQLLPPLPKRMLSGGRRSLSDLPTPTPGKATVLRTGGRYVTIDEGRLLRGNEDIVVHAVAALVVDMRTRPIAVGLNIPSCSAADDFAITVTFHVRVEHPEVAAEHGAIDLVGELQRYVRRDRVLLEIGEQYGVDDIAEVRRLVESRIEAYCELLPFSVPGLRVLFSDAQVLTPEEVRAEEKQKRSEILADESRQRAERREYQLKLRQGDWTADIESREARRNFERQQQEDERAYVLQTRGKSRDYEDQLTGGERAESLRRLEEERARTRRLIDTRYNHELRMIEEERRRAYEAYADETEDARFARMEELTARGPDALTAAAIVRGELPTLQAEMNARTRQEDARRLIFEGVQLLQNSHAFDYSDVHAQHLVDTLIEQVTGQPPAQRVELPEAPSAAKTAAQASLSGSEYQDTEPTSSYENEEPSDDDDPLY